MSPLILRIITKLRITPQKLEERDVEICGKPMFTNLYADQNTFLKNVLKTFFFSECGLKA